MTMLKTPDSRRKIAIFYNTQGVILSIFDQTGETHGPEKLSYAAPWL